MTNEVQIRQSNITLPPLDKTKPNESYTLPITLALVEELERTGGGLLKVAERLLQKDLPLSDMVKILSVAYQFAGCPADKATLENSLLNNAAPLILADILLALLTPLHSMGAITEIPAGESMGE